MDELAELALFQGAGTGSAGGGSRVVQGTFARSSTAHSVSTSAMATTTGNTIVVSLACFGDHIGVTPVDDSVGLTWIAAIPSTGTTKGFAAQFYAKNITGNAAHTFRFTTTGADDFIVIVVHELEGMSSTAPLNHTNAASVSGTTHTSGSITADAGKREIAIGFGALSASAELSPTITTVENAWSGQAQAATASLEGWVSGVAFVPAGKTVTFTYTTSNAQFETALIAGYKEA